MGNISLKIKGLLKERGLTYEQFGEGIGKTKQTVVNYINKRTKIDTKTIKEIADFFEVPVGYFFNDGNEYTYRAGKTYSRESETNYETGSEKNEPEKDLLLKEIEYLKRENEILHQLVKDKEDIIKLLKK
jgi:transcriptional regulator with XRE-family HTH domain